VAVRVERHGAEVTGTREGRERSREGAIERGQEEGV